MPDSVTMTSARLLTWIADRIKKPPLLDLSVDQISLMKQGFIFDGSKATRELGLTYTTIPVAVERALASIIAERSYGQSSTLGKASV